VTGVEKMVTVQAKARTAEQNEQRSQELEYLMRRFGDQVLRLAYYYLRDRYLAEDVAQEVFCRVYQNLDDFRHESSYFTWIHRITVNLCRDHLRSAAFRRWIPWGDSHTLEGIGGKTERHLEAVEGGEVLQKVMDLPVKYRVVLALHYFHDYSTREIAEITGIREGTVRVHLSRARQMLKKRLTQGVEENAGPGTRH
jgi:RNA polymerase sigma-70 factor (ECF subfamily)